MNHRAAFSKKPHRSRTDLSTERSVRMVGINFLGVAECLKGMVISLVNADALKSFNSGLVISSFNLS